MTAWLRSPIVMVAISAVAGALPVTPATSAAPLACRQPVPAGSATSGRRGSGVGVALTGLVGYVADDARHLDRVARWLQVWGRQPEVRRRALRLRAKESETSATATRSATNRRRPRGQRKPLRRRVRAQGPPTATRIPAGLLDARRRRVEAQSGSGKAGLPLGGSQFVVISFRMSPTSRGRAREAGAGVARASLDAGVQAAAPAERRKSPDRAGLGRGRIDLGPARCPSQDQGLSCLSRVCRATSSGLRHPWWRCST